MPPRRLGQLGSLALALQRKQSGPSAQGKLLWIGPDDSYAEGMASNLEFMCNGQKVGCFEAREYPSAPGLYRYMPYRSFGHYEMGKLFRRQGAARCYYDIDECRVLFTVSGRPEYGVLELRDFESSLRS